MLAAKWRGALLITGIALAALAAAHMAASRSAAERHSDSNRQSHAPPSAAGITSVRVDATVGHQVIDGFGANVAALFVDDRSPLKTALRARAVDAAYGQVRLTMGMIDPMLLESRGGRDQIQNDNADPNVIDWSGFQTGAVDALKSELFDLPAAVGLDNYHLGQRINTKWGSPWLAALRRTDYNLYLDEAAEQVVAACVYWRDKFGTAPRFLQLFNEPLSGNHELRGGTTQDLVDIVRRTGDRLTREGFGAVRFVVASEETEEKSYESAAAILGDVRARAYVGAIGYHPYPYGSVYVNIPRLLRTSGAGRPDADRVAARQRLRDLTRKYDLPLWMTEISNGGVDPRSFDDFRGRAIHIHDELVYADASAYFAMGSMWDLARPVHGSIVAISGHEGTAVLVDSRTDTVEVTGIGHALGHYARWVPRGAIRVNAEADDSLLQVIAFRDVARRKLVLVLINNAALSQSVSVKIAGVRLDGQVRGEQSTQSAYWSALTFVAPDADGFDVTVPALSVTTLAAALEESSAPVSTRLH